MKTEDNIQDSKPTEPVEILPNALYPTHVVEVMIRGYVSIRKLRELGDLIALPGGGYWGRDLIAAISRMQDLRHCQLETSSRSSKKEQDDHEENKDRTSSQTHDNHGGLGSKSKKGEKLESERTGGRPRIHSSRPRRQPLANQCRKLEQFAQEVKVDCIES